MSGSAVVVGSGSKYATTIHLCVGSILSSVGIMFLTKQLMTEIHSPSYLNMVTFCTMWHQITAATFTKLSTVLGLQSTPPEEENVRPRVVIALAIGGSILFNNWALALLPVGTCQLFKLLCIPSIAIIQFIFHGQRVPLNVCGSLALLLIGVGIATVEHLSLQFLPASIALCGVLLTAISQAMVQSYNKKNVPLQSMHLLQVTSPYIASFMAICFVILENIYPSGILDASTWNTGYALPVLVLSCIVSIATNFDGYCLLQTCSAVTFQVIGNLKTITVLMASFACADLVPSGKSVFGIVIALIGSGFYSMIQINHSNNIERLPTEIIQIQRSCPNTKNLSIQQRCRALFTTVQPRQVLTITVSAFVVLLLLYYSWDASSKYGSDKQFEPDNRDEQLKGSLYMLRDTIDSGDIDMIDPNDRDALVVNGCFMDPLTKANNWTDLTAPIMLANECLVQVSKRCSTPNVYHGVWLGGRFKLHHAMSFKSIYTRMRPFAFYIHGYDFPVGDDMWDHAVRTYNIILVPTRRIEKVFGIPINAVEHKADVIRLETVLRFGGVYTDSDVWVLKDLSALLARNTTIMDREGPVGICNSFIGTPRCSVFVKMWYSKYQSFGNSCWECHSVKLPHLLNMQIPGNLYVTGDQPTPTYINSPTFYNAGYYLYGEGIWDFTNNWAVHTWWRLWGHEPTMSEWENGTLADGTAIPVGISRLSRNILFDDQL